MYENILTCILLIPAVYTWKKLLRSYKSYQKEYNEEELFHRRHNCVVMHSKFCLKGWAPLDYIKVTKDNYKIVTEPYLYFITTAKENLDVSMMQIGIESFYSAILETANRGVRVRMIVNFTSILDEFKFYKILLKAGVKVSFYIEKSPVKNNIMHCKYMLKDYKTGNGFLCMGSLNFTTIDSLMQNYEDFTFISNRCLVEEFLRSFETCLQIIDQANIDLIYNKAILLEKGLL